MPEYITKLQVQEIMQKHYPYANLREEHALYKINRDIKALPAADVVEVRRGRWTHHESYELADGGLAGEAYCSECELYSTQIVFDGRVSYNFCPRCGAKMDGGAEP